VGTTGKYGRRKVVISLAIADDVLHLHKLQSDLSIDVKELPANLVI
jgi:hypothetical protein